MLFFSSTDDIMAMLLLMIASTFMFYISLKMKELEDVPPSYKHVLDDASFLFANAIPWSMAELALPDELFIGFIPSSSDALTELLKNVGVYAFSILDDLPSIFLLYRGAKKLRIVAIEKSGLTDIKLKILTMLVENGAECDIKLIEKYFKEKICSEEEFDEAINTLDSHDFIQKMGDQKINQKISITEYGKNYLHEMRKPLRNKMSQLGKSSKSDSDQNNMKKGKS